MGWEKAKEPGVVKRLKQIAQLVERLRKELLEQEVRRIEGMAETLRYFREAKRSDESVG
ncbi:MAG: hypothetical protein KJZ87_02450 [Thermoguttaceae bacterium]|nr:hypothetical protein [Thermoguttaceae bacterium]